MKKLFLLALPLVTLLYFFLSENKVYYPSPDNGETEVKLDAKEGDNKTKKNKWFLFSCSNTPNQAFWSAKYLPALKIARFGTYGRGILDFHFKDFISSSSSEVTKENTISLYPNPASEFLYSSFKGDNTILNRFYVFDVHGNKLSAPFKKQTTN
ncbi:MAG: hypothetical protein IPN10_16480 [Saprospiraceae bacterium]|nr:hypothetical protein [Saprospiraceae bacterium]